MSYGIVNQCFGIIFGTMERGIERKHKAFIKDLILHYDSSLKNEIESFSDTDLVSFVEEIAITWTEYTSSGFTPCVLGFHVNSWPYWKLMGPDGIVEAVYKSKNGPDDFEKNDKWFKTYDDITYLLEKHDLYPGSVWLASTS